MSGISRRYRNACAVCGASTLILGTILAVQVSGHLMATGFLQLSWKRSFDAQVWAFWKPNDLDANLRWTMVNDLQTHYLKPGMTRDAVRELLGREWSGERSPCLSYPVGNDGEDSVTLIIDFDKKGRLLHSDLHFN